MYGNISIFYFLNQNKPSSSSTCEVRRNIQPATVGDSLLLVLQTQNLELTHSRRWISTVSAPELESTWNIMWLWPHVVSSGDSDLAPLTQSNLAWIAVDGSLFSLPGWAKGAVPKALLQRTKPP